MEPVSSGAAEAGSDQAELVGPLVAQSVVRLIGPLASGHRAVAAYSTVSRQGPRDQAPSQAPRPRWSPDAKLMPWASFGAAITMLMLGPDGGGDQIGNGYMALHRAFLTGTLV
jgi:hypothetical protein